MKHLFTTLTVLVGLFVSGCIDENTSSAAKVLQEQGAISEAAAKAMSDSAAFTSIQWIDSIKNMGTIQEGQQLEVVFRFKNTGATPLVIQSANPSCGCTVPEKPEAPVMPGAEASIKAVFSSDGRSGTNHKTITVVANTKGTQNHVLEFNVEVTPKNESTAANQKIGQSF